MRIEVATTLPLIARALNRVPHVRNHAGLEESLPAVIPVDTPLIARALGPSLEFARLGMQSPHAGIDSDAFFLRRARLADKAVCKDAVGSVKPAIGPPDEIIERLVRILPAPAIEHHFRLGVRFVVAVFVREKKEIGRSSHPHAAVAYLNAAGEGELVVENGALVRLSVTIGVLEN